MALKCGIIGITNTGKTTIFNCVSDKKAEITDFAFGGTKSNIGIVKIPDPRLETLNEMVKPDKITYATMELVDIPGLAKGASEGEGLGNKFLDEVSRSDALIHVLRCFDDDNLPHVEGSVDPVRDIEIVDLELQIRDMHLIDRKIERLNKLVKTGDKEAKKALEVMSKIQSQLEEFKNVREMNLSEEELEHTKEMYLLTEKPVLFVCNVDDDSAVEGNKYSISVQEFLRDKNAEVLTIAGKLESEISELEEEEERVEFLEDAGLSEPSVNRMIRSAYHLLNLQSFLTQGPKEVRAWTIKKGMTAPEAAGVIHSDIKRGFIRAEVIKFDDFVNYGNENAVKEAGKMHLEGKKYIVEDGDIILYRFNV
jgi:GTP-binding protein YchF